jgi:hypothetical protein
LGEGGVAFGDFFDFPFEFAGGDEGATDVEEVVGLEGEAALGSVHGRAYIPCPPNRHITPRIQQTIRLLRFLLPPLRFHKVNGRAQRPRQRFATAKAGVTGKSVKHFIKFKQLVRFFVHGIIRGMSMDSSPKRSLHGWAKSPFVLRVWGKKKEQAV